MPFTLKQIRYFLAVAEAEQVSAAARAVNISQSALTLAIRDLEAELGTKLFVRKPTGLQLTQEGHRFLTHAEEIDGQVTRALHSVKSAEDPLTGTLRIGTTDTLSGYFLMPQLARFRREHPDVHIQLTEVVRPDLEAKLLAQEIDLALLLTSNVRSRKELKVETFHRSRRCLWTAAGHPLAEKPQVSIRDLETYPIVLLHTDEAEASARSIWASFSLKPNVIFESASIEAVRNMVGQGLAITVLSDVVYRPWTVDGLRVMKRELEEELPSMDVGIACHVSNDDFRTVSVFRKLFTDN